MKTGTLATNQSDKLALATYRGLVKRVRETFVLGQKRIETLKVGIYWDTGFFINEHLRLNQARAEYGEKVLEKLSSDAGVHVTVLERCARFAGKFPDFKIPAGRRELPASPGQIEKAAPRNSLTWAHYRLLLTVPDDKKRFALEARALQKNWTAEELEKRVYREDGRTTTAGPPELLVPKRGETGLFRIIEDSGALHWDKGFASYRRLQAGEEKKFKAKDLVRLTPKGTLEKAPDAGPSRLYTYEAELLRVIDADTYWMRIWLVPPDWCKEKLRLRGVDAPERGTPEGKRAARFVKGLFAKARKITITTTKPDQWDRYLTDVFLRMPSGEEIFLNNLLLKKGRAYRYDRVRLEDWESE